MSDNDDKKNQQVAKTDGAPAGASRGAGVRKWLSEKRPKGLFSGGGKFNFLNPGEPDHWLENAIEFVYQSVLMLFLLAYPLVLIYAASIAFVPVNLTTMWFGVSWTDVLAVISTLVLNGTHHIVKRRHQRSKGGFTWELLTILGLKTILLMLGLMYSFFQNPWAATPQPFQMPHVTMLINPIFLGLAALIIMDTWNPRFLRQRVLADDENQAKVNKK